MAPCDKKLKCDVPMSTKQCWPNTERFNKYIIVDMLF